MLCTPQGTISDYTPTVCPMVPALVVHCTIEVEQRGAQEVGVYRVSPLERDVKELKVRGGGGEVVSLCGADALVTFSGKKKTKDLILSTSNISMSYWSVSHYAVPFY